MNCEDCEKLLPEFACGATSAADAAEVQRHLADGCERCEKELEFWREAAALVALTTQSIDPPAKLKSALLAKARTTVATPQQEAITVVGTRVVTARRGAWRTAIPYIAATLCALMAGVAAVRLADRRLEQQAAAERDFERRMAEARQAFPSQRIRRAALGRVGAPSPADGQIVWDAFTGELHLYAFDLGDAPVGHHFAFWIVTSADEWIPLGKLRSAEDGNCSAIFEVPSRPMEIVRAVITEEPDENAGTAANSHPRGPERMVADFTDRPVPPAPR